MKLEALIAGWVPMRNIKAFGKDDIWRNPIDKIECQDGFHVSAQASHTHYCSPRDNFGPYTELELGYPSEMDDLIKPFAEEPDTCSTVFPYVPVDIVRQLIAKHGGEID